MYIETGYIDADSAVEFQRHSDACNQFGHNYKQWYRAVAQHPVETDLIIWFPRMFDNPNWENTVSDNEETIIERKKQDNDVYVQECLSRPEWFKRLVFAAELNPRRKVIYRFKGLYAIDTETSKKNSMITFRRQSKRVKTYAPILSQ
jgi:hypothetical protein